MNRHPHRLMPICGLALILAGALSPALAAQHLISVQEVYVGPSQQPEAQYIQLQMYAGGQNLVAGHRLRVFDAVDTIVGSYNFADNVANGTDQATILIATAAAQTRFGIAADLEMSADIPPSGGKICFEDFDCFAWGDYMGDTVNPDRTGNAFSAATGLQPDRAARRRSDGGSDPGRLDAADDSGDSASDFFYASQPAPMNNAGQDGASAGGDSGNGNDPYNEGGTAGGGRSSYSSGSLPTGTTLLLLLAVRRLRATPANRETR